VYIIPEPKEVFITEGNHFIVEGCPIVIPKYSQSDFNSAKCLKEKMREITGTDFAIEAHSHLGSLNHYILLLNLSNCEGKYENYHSETYKQVIKAEGYLLEVTNDHIVIVSLDDSGLFYGVQTLNQILNNVKGLHLPLIKIVDYPDLPVRGVMLDISRNWVPTLETLKTLVNDLSHYKINQFQLYMEPHVFASRRHPIISQGHGAVTAEELMALGEVCARLHIDFVPNFQSFGHVSHVLMHKEYEHLAEDPTIKDCLSPAVDETYSFLADYYSEFLPLFNSNIMHAGCDETYEIRNGNGKSSELSKTIGTAGVFFKHIEKIRELAMEHGKHIMIWVDQITHSKDKEYQNHTLKLMKDIVLVNWWYNADWNYDEKAKMLEQTGCRHMFCPGTSSWLRFYPEYSMSKRNIRNFSKAAIQHNTMGILFSDWGDGGHINLPAQSYYGFLYAANVAWSIHTDNEPYFEKAFCLNFIGEDSSHFSKINEILSELCDVARIDNEFRNVLVEICFFDGLISDEHTNKKDLGLLKWGRIDRTQRASEYTDPQRMERVAQLLDQASMHYQSIIEDDWKQKRLYEELGFTIKQLIFVVKKYEIILALKNKEVDIGKMRVDLELLLEENDELQNLFSRLWVASAHPEGVNMHLARFDWVRKDIQMVMENFNR